MVAGKAKKYMLIVVQASQIRVAGLCDFRQRTLRSVACWGGGSLAPCWGGGSLAPCARRITFSCRKQTCIACSFEC